MHHTAPDINPPQSRVILVVGPHRSGTSALTRTLNLVGATLPEDLLQPAPDNNERGFWEPRKIVELQDEMLESAGSAWDDTSRLCDGWFKSDVAASFADRLSGILSQMYRDAPLLLVKDPRLCALLPLWHLVFQRLEISALHVLPIRNPLEVAHSLHARDGFPLAKGLLLWLRNSLDAERATRGYPRCFVTYTDLLRDWNAVIDKVSRELDISWPRRSASTAVEIQEFLSTNLRHQISDDDLPNSTHPWVVRAYRTLQRLAKDQGSSSGELDAIVSEMEFADGIFSEALAGLDRQLRQFREAALLEARRRERDVNEALVDNEQLVKELEAVKAQLDASRAENQLLANHQSELESRLDQTERDALATRNRLTRMTSTLSWRITTPLRIAGRLTKLGAQKPDGRRRGLSLKPVLDTGERVLHHSPLPRPLKQHVVNQARRLFPGYVKNPSYRQHQRQAQSSETMTDSPPGPWDWKSDWRSLFPPREQAANRILIVDWRLPTPDLDSGSYRMTKIIDAILDTGVAVDFIGAAPANQVSPDITSEQTNAYRTALEKKGIKVIEGIDRAAAHLASKGGVYHTVILSRPQVASDYVPLARAFCPQALVIFDTVDLHWIRFSRAAEVKDTAEERRELEECASRFKRLELAIARSVDLTLAITQDELEILRAEVPNLAVDVLPNIHETADQVAPVAGRKGLLFIGGFAHTPNVEAVEYFIKHIFPLIRQKIEGVELFILGSAMPHEVKRLANRQIHAVGYVNDVEPYFQRARVFVCPLLHGAGMKGKVGQSLSLGLPLVTTSIGAEGIGLVDGRNAFVSDDPKGFADRVVRLYTDDALWNRFSKNGRSIIKDNFSSQAVSDRIKRILNHHD